MPKDTLQNISTTPIIAGSEYPQADVKVKPSSRAKPSAQAVDSGSVFPKSILEAEAKAPKTGPVQSDKGSSVSTSSFVSGKGDQAEGPTVQRNNKQQVSTSGVLPGPKGEPASEPASLSGLSISSKNAQSHAEIVPTTGIARGGRNAESQHEEPVAEIARNPKQMMNSTQESDGGSRTLARDNKQQALSAHAEPTPEIRRDPKQMHQSSAENTGFGSSVQRSHALQEQSTREHIPSSGIRVQDKNAQSHAEATSSRPMAAPTVAAEYIPKQERGLGKSDRNYHHEPSQVFAGVEKTNSMPSRSPAGPTPSGAAGTSGTNPMIRGGHNVSSFTLG